MAKPLKNIKKCCPCCRNYNVPVRENGFCADCDEYLKPLLSALNRIWAMVEEVTDSADAKIALGKIQVVASIALAKEEDRS